MSSTRPNERRHNARREFSSEFQGRRLLPSGVAEAATEAFHGHIQNVSEGGIGIAVDQKLSLYDLIRGEVILPNVAVGIPSLLQVRWTKKVSNHLRYRVGLQFLL